MSAKDKISKVASLWYVSALISGTATYFSVKSQTFMSTLFGLALSLGTTFLVHRLLLGGSGLTRKVVLFCNLVGLVISPFALAASVYSFSAAPLRASAAIVWMVWSFLLNFRSFSVLKDAGVKRHFA